MHKRFYRDGKKRVPPTLRIDPIMLAVWFMDDGSKSRDRDIYLNTQQFRTEDQERCRRILLADFGIESRMNRDKQYWRLRLIKSSLPVLWKLITPYVIPVMRYKLGYNPVETCRESGRVIANAMANTPTPSLIGRVKI